MNYKTMMIGMSFLFLITLMAPVKSEVVCYSIPGEVTPICISKTNPYNNYMNQIYVTTPPRYDVQIESRKAPQHNYSECTIATGCNPYK